MPDPASSEAHPNVTAAATKTLAADLPPGKAVSILVQRQGNPIFLALKTEE